MYPPSGSFSSPVIKNDFLKRFPTEHGDERTGAVSGLHAIRVQDSDNVGAGSFGRGDSMSSVYKERFLIKN